jgi:hypothetical protein
MLTLYHGSNAEFTVPGLEYARDRRDFGVGFYTTALKEQAVAWAFSMYERYGGAGAFLYTFELTETDTLTVLEYPEISIEWLDMVKDNRLSGGTQHSFDVVIGPVANDNTIRTVSLYVEGVYDTEDAMRRLRYFKANNQVSLHTQKALDRLVLKAREQLV